MQASLESGGWWDRYAYQSTSIAKVLEAQACSRGEVPQYVDGYCLIATCHHGDAASSPLPRWSSGGLADEGCGSTTPPPRSAAPSKLITTSRQSPAASSSSSNQPPPRTTTTTRRTSRNRCRGRPVVNNGSQGSAYSKPPGAQLINARKKKIPVMVRSTVRHNYQ